MATLLLVIIYVCYIGLGVPDSLLGTAWPVIYEELDLPVSYVSIVSMLISGGTVISSLLSVRLVARLGPIFPNMTYLTPKLFGAEVSQSVIGIQMASFYLSIMLTPAFFGVLAQNMGICCSVPFLSVMFVMMAGMIIYVKCIKS